MKLILAIVNRDDSNAVSASLTKEGFSVTKLSTTGGFLLAGNVTMMIGVEEDKVDRVIAVISEHSKQRTEIVPSTASCGVGVTTAFPLEVTVGGATVFVIDVERFVKL